MILVNISESLSQQPKCSIKEAIEAALQNEPLLTYQQDYIVGVSGGIPFGIFKMVSALDESIQDIQERFILQSVNREEIMMIMNALKGIQKNYEKNTYLNIPLTASAA